MMGGEHASMLTGAEIRVPAVSRPHSRVPITDASIPDNSTSVEMGQCLWGTRCGELEVEKENGRRLTWSSRVPNRNKTSPRCRYYRLMMITDHGCRVFEVSWGNIYTLWSLRAWFEWRNLASLRDRCCWGLFRWAQCFANAFPDPRAISACPTSQLEDPRQVHYSYRYY